MTQGFWDTVIIMIGFFGLIGVLVLGNELYQYLRGVW